MICRALFGRETGAMKGHELSVGRITLIAGIIGLITACIYLALAVGAGSTEYQCRAKDSCSKTIVRKCRQCELQSSTVAGILGQMRNAPCGPNPFRSVQEAPQGTSSP